MAGPERRSCRSCRPRSKRLWEALAIGYLVLGLDRACREEVFEQPVLARIIEPTSKLDTIRVLEEIGIPGV
jgi:hypothetical protein